MIKRKKLLKEELFKNNCFSNSIYLLNYLNLNDFDVCDNLFHAKVKNLINIKQILLFLISFFDGLRFR